MEGDSAQLLDRQARLTSQVWPAGIPSREQKVLDAVPLPERKQLLDRLEAVWRADRGEPLAPLADLAGLKRAAFYNLRRAWRERSLAALVPHDTRSGRRVDVPDDDPLRAQARDVLRADPAIRNVDAAKAVLDREPALLSDGAGPHHALTVLQRLERLVREERRWLTADSSFVRQAYGSGIILDLTAVQIVIDGEERTLAVAAILMESASGLVIASALGLKDEGVGLQRQALSEGLAFLDRNRADVPSKGAAYPDLGVMLPASVNAERIVQAMKSRVRDLTVGRAGGFSYGQQVVQVTGPRIGRIPLTPRRVLSCDIDEFLQKRKAPIVTIEQARALWAREVERHNADRLTALADAGIMGRGLADGRLANVIRPLLDVIVTS